MIHIASSHFKSMPWRNGGGVTHEIAREGEGVDFGWRISIADVATSGPFSLFPHHKRLLCVITGHGMDLVTSTHVYDARPFEPVAFDGDEKIDGQLRDGPCRDFNLIFDSKSWRGDMTVLRGTKAINAASHLTGLYVLEGYARCAETNIPAGDFCFLQNGSEDVLMSNDAIVLKIDLQKIKAS